MSELHFTKFHGAGNDFIMALDLPENPCPEAPEIIRALCNRRFGIGADGVIWLSPLQDSIRFSYWNPDGSRAAMCGNGLRCAMEFAAVSGLVKGKQAVFTTDAGKLEAERLAPGRIRIRMPDFQPFQKYSVSGIRCFLTNTGVPHAIVEVPAIETVDVDQTGRRLRFAAEFAPEGTNVDFIQVLNPDTARIRTYERGVEAETPACGTGIAAAGAYLAAFYNGNQKKSIFCCSGDELSIEITKNGNILKEIYLTGPAKRVFSGTIELDKNLKSDMEN